MAEPCFRESVEVSTKGLHCPCRFRRLKVYQGQWINRLKGPFPGFPKQSKKLQWPVKVDTQEEVEEPGTEHRSKSSLLMVSQDGRVKGVTWQQAVPSKPTKRQKQSRTEPTGCCSLRTGYVAQAGFEIVILLPQLPECWN